jgi:hypothetical protein
MPQRYAHLSPSHLRQYADRTLLDAPEATEAGTREADAGKARKCMNWWLGWDSNP